MDTQHKAAPPPARRVMRRIALDMSVWEGASGANRADTLVRADLWNIGGLLLVSVSTNGGKYAVTCHPLRGGFTSVWASHRIHNVVDEPHAFDEHEFAERNIPPSVLAKDIMKRAYDRACELRMAILEPVCSKLMVTFGEDEVRKFITKTHFEETQAFLSAEEVAFERVHEVALDRALVVVRTQAIKGKPIPKLNNIVRVMVGGPSPHVFEANVT